MRTRLLSVGTFFLIMAVACRARLTTPPSSTEIPLSEVHLGTPSRISQTPYVFEPHIAVDPTDPNHLAAVVVASPEFDCDAQTCQTTQVLFYSSNDGGTTWSEQPAFDGALGSIDGMVGFGPTGTLSIIGLAYTVFGGRAAINQTDANGEFHPTKFWFVASDGADKPWLTHGQRADTLYVSYTAFTSEHLHISVARSLDGGITWRVPVAVSQEIKLSAAWLTQVGDAHAMIGRDNNLAVAWIWPEGTHDWPMGLWIATSADGGQTFSVPQRLGATWGHISTTSDQGNYYLFYRQGSEQHQELVVARSNDNGTTWQVSSVSRALPMYFDPDKAPGVDVAPNGTLDVVFYAHDESAPECVARVTDRSPRNRLELGWVDACRYGIYYTFSRDEGRSFSTPVQLNTVFIIGARSVRTQGYSRPGEYIGMASTDTYAYPIWIETQDEEGTQAYMVQITR